jgi:3-deoxy-D-manno-octulosonic-acid transferase
VVLHAVSVGETAACRTLVPLLAERAEVIVSVTTDTGLARARSLYGAVCDVVRTPLDFSWAVRRFLDKTRPDVLGLGRAGGLAEPGARVRGAGRADRRDQRSLE